MGLYVLVMSRKRFRVNPHSIVAWTSTNSLLKEGAKSEVLSDCNWTRTNNHLVRKRTHDHLVFINKQFVKEHFVNEHFNFRFRACFEQGVSWHSGNYRVLIHFEMRTWHDKNIQSHFYTSKYFFVFYIYFLYLYFLFFYSNRYFTLNYWTHFC